MVGGERSRRLIPDDIDRSWVFDGQCKNTHWSEFDINGNQYTASNALQNQARALCHGCPVYIECAEDAILFGDVSIIRAGCALGTNKKRNVEMLQDVIINGIPAPIRKSDKPKRTCDHSTPWSDARCEVCKEPLRPNTIPKDQAPPGTKLAHNKRMCRSCYQTIDDDQRSKEADARLRGKWKDRKCRKCSTSLRPRGKTLTEWPGTVEIHSDNQCKTCWRAEVAAMQPNLIRQQAQQEWADRKCIHCDSYLRPPTPYIEDFPDTKPAHSQEVCQACHRKNSRNDQPLPSTA